MNTKTEDLFEEKVIKAKEQIDELIKEVHKKIV
jgi:hypothetical protein